MYMYVYYFPMQRKKMDIGNQEIASITYPLKPRRYMYMYMYMCAMHLYVHVYVQCTCIYTHVFMCVRVYCYVCILW